MRLQDTTDKSPKPSKHYAFIAKRAQKYGIQVGPEDFETIDAWIEAVTDWQNHGKRSS
jgi:hypothetical protein